MTSINYSFSTKNPLVSLIESADIEQLRQLNLDLNQLETKDSAGDSLLSVAKKLKQQRVLDEFFQIATNTLTPADKLDHKGRNLVHWAVKCNQSQAKLVELQSQGYDFNSHNNPYQLTPLYLACQEGNAQLIESLLTLGADSNIAVINGGTPLHAACEFCDFSAVEALIKSGADVNAYFELAGTPLCIAAHLGRKEIVESLLKANASFSFTNKEGKTPLEIAQQKQHEKIINILANMS